MEVNKQMPINEQCKRFPTIRDMNGDILGPSLLYDTICPEQGIKSL